jgi:hypothetical protein
MFCHIDLLDFQFFYYFLSVLSFSIMIAIKNALPILLTLTRFKSSSTSRWQHTFIAHVIFIWLVMVEPHALHLPHVVFHISRWAKDLSLSLLPNASACGLLGCQPFLWHSTSLHALHSTQMCPPLLHPSTIFLNN